jgi:Fe-S cluster assembly protein SufD
MAAVAERHGALATVFEAFRQDPAFGPEWLQRAREHALGRFLEAGFPTTRDEDWRFTNVAPIAETAFVRAAPASVDRRAIESFLFAGPGCQIVVVNGRVSKTLSSLAALPAGVTVRTLADPLPHSGPAAPQPLEIGGRASASGRNSIPTSTPFVALNDAFFEDLLAITVAPGAIVAEPIFVLSLAVTETKPVMVLPRLTISVGEGAQVSIVESYATIGAGQSLTSAVTDVAVGPNAIVRHVKIQRESMTAFHIAATNARLERAATFASTAVTLGGRIARNDITATLDGDGAECTLNGLYVADGDSLVDTHTTIDHAQPHCPSHEVYKGILGGRARAVFNGKIIVRQDAQKTNAKQTNKALLLSDDAQINSKPQLEIFADDVKCTHGAAIGQLDEDAMFYLRARGIAEDDARNLLIHAFVGEVLAGVTVEAVRDSVMKLIEEKLSLV